MEATVPAFRPAVRAGLVTAHVTRAGGGVYTSARQIAWALEKEPGIEVNVFGVGWAKGDYTGWSPLIPRVSQVVGPEFFSYAPGLVGSLKGAELNLVHLHGLWMYTSAASLEFTRQTKKPHMISPHGMLDAWALGNSGWKKRLAAWAYEDANLHGAACLHALNTAEVGAIREYGYEGPVCVIPNGVHLPEAAKPLPKPWWTKSAPDARTILYLGRLHPKKGLHMALTAWSQINPALRNEWRLVIAGWDENNHQTALRRKAAGLRIEDTVTFPGPLFSDDKRAAYQHCDGFILPSLSEGLPMAALEAWGAGKPVLMTPECNLAEGYEAGAAMRIEADEADIAAGMTNFMSLTDAERAAMGAKGLALVREKYSWPVIASEMAAVYRWVAANGTKPATVIEK